MPQYFKTMSPTVLIIAIGAMVGASLMLSKFVAIAGVAPQLALFGQLAFASLTLLVLAIASGRWPPLGWRYLGYYLGAGILGISGPTLIAYAVLGHISTGLYAALVTLSPLFTFAITAMVEKRMLPMYRLVGILIGLTGISFATVSGVDLAGIAPHWIGLAITGPLLLAMGNVFRSRTYPAGGESMALATGTLTLQFLLVGLSFLISGQFSEIVLPDIDAIASIAGVGLITAISYALTFEVQRRTDGVGFAQVGYFATLFGIGFGAIVFGEPIHLALVLSLLVLFFGLMITNGHFSLARLRPSPKAKTLTSFTPTKLQGD